nr:hypothetical protein Iba_chr06bCG9830 [Ipomoea batatas]
MPSRRTDRDKETSMDLTPTGLHFDGCCLPCVTLYAQMPGILILYMNEYSIMLKLPSKSQCDFAKATEVRRSGMTQEEHELLVKFFDKGAPSWRW